MQQITEKREINTGPSEDWKTFTRAILDSYIEVQTAKNVSSEMEI